MKDVAAQLLAGAVRRSVSHRPVGAGPVVVASGPAEGQGAMDQRTGDDANHERGEQARCGNRVIAAGATPLPHLWAR